MKNSLFYLLLITFICFASLCSANTTKVDPNSQEVENWLKGSDTKTDTTTSTGSETKTSTTTSSSTSTDTVVITDSSEKTDTVTTTKTNTSSDTKTNTSSSTGTETTAKPGSPFSDDTEVKDTESAEPTKITDLDTAKACGINEIAKGFPKNGKVANTGGSQLRLRSWPWGNVLSMYPEGTAVKVLGESGEFYLVEVDGKQGYMHKNYISIEGKDASGKAPYYPGDTRNGGALSLKEGVQASKDGAEGKVPSTTGGTPGKVTISGDKVVLDVPKKNQYQANTPAPGSSCGPTSLAMCLSFFGKGDPSVLVTDLYHVCGCTASDGTGHAGLEKGAKKYGMSNAKFYYSVSQDWCRQQLKAGKPVLCHVAHHYVVMKGIDSNGNVILNDPAWKTVERTMSWSDFSVWWSNSGLGHSAMTF